MKVTIFKIMPKQWKSQTYLSLGNNFVLKNKHSIQTIITIYCYSIESCLFVRLLVCFMDDSVWIFPRALWWFLWSCDGLWVREVLPGLGLCQALSRRICVELGLHLSPVDELFHLQQPHPPFNGDSLPPSAECLLLIGPYSPSVTPEARGFFSLIFLLWCSIREAKT